MAKEIEIGLVFFRDQYSLLVDGGVFKVFQDCVEVHMQHIQQGLRLVMIFKITKLVAEIEDDNDFDGNSWEWQQS